MLTNVASPKRNSVYYTSAFLSVSLNTPVSVFRFDKGNVYHMSNMYSTCMCALAKI